MTKLSTVTVGAGGSSTVSFTNIPQGYTDLKFIFSAQGTRASDFDGIYLSFNGSTDNFTGKYSQAITPSTPTSGSLGRYVGAFPATNLTSKFGSAELYVSGYSSNKYKMYSVDAVTGGYASNQALLEFINSVWSNPTPVTSVSFTFLLGNFAQYSTVTMYGIKNAAQTAGNSIKATGGNIVFDGTYVYHVFNSTGAFVPSQSLTADALVIAGGGGGGTANRGGGGGAGGVIYFARQSLTPASYTCTVGSGGAGFTSGTDSQFSSLTVASGGGRGGASNFGGAYLAAAGGSGGGNGNDGTNNGGASTQSGTGATAYYGNRGGNVTVGGDVAGGGGAGAAGTDGVNTSNGISGGNGTSAFSSWGVATGAGQNVSGTYYFAGGGAGGANYSAGGALYTSRSYGGGGINSSSSYDSYGLANTGSGGSGFSYNSGAGTYPAGAGGSGIVIIRYKG
jgi:hypothetical protein